MSQNIILQKIDDYRWRIPKSYMRGMRVDGIVGVVSPGGIGYDINCGVRLIRTNLKDTQLEFARWNHGYPFVSLIRSDLLLQFHQIVMDTMQGFLGIA